MSWTADARQGAQVLRVKTGVDARWQVVKESRFVTKTLSKVGMQKGMADGTPCEPPACEDPEVLDLFAEDPVLRQMIVQFHETQQHLQELLPALQAYQLHRQGLADAEQRLGIALQEAGQRNTGPLSQALQACGLVRCKAATRRAETHKDEDRNVVSGLITHNDEAFTDCKRAVQAYEAARKELRLLYDAKETARATKQQLIDSGANQVDSHLTPPVSKISDETESLAKEKLQATATAARAKLAMLEAKHRLQYATAIASNMKNYVQEEAEIAKSLGSLGEAVATIQESGNDAGLAS